MKKVALVAPHKEYNYGTVLQAYALQKMVEAQGFKTEYLQYTTILPPPLWKVPLRKLRALYHNINLKKPVITNNGLDDYSFFRLPEFHPFVEGIEQFTARYIKESTICYNPVSLKKCSKYDAFMVGSDQTWSEARYRPEWPYFLDYPAEKYLRLSYAPSIGTTHISTEYLDILKSKLKNFQALSCREKSNCDTLGRALGRKVDFVLDPTLLLSAEDWNAIATTPKQNMLKKKQYILCYILGEKKSISDFALKLGKQKGLPIFFIVTRPLYLGKPNHLFATPETFLSLIRDAAYVVTDSFHGSIFSINFNTQFYSFTKREDTNQTNDNDRILEMLKTFNLQNRYQEGTYNFVEDTDWREANKLLVEFRNNSTNYLMGTLNQIK